MGAVVVVDMHRSWGTRGSPDNRFIDGGESPLRPSPVGGRLVSSIELEAASNAASRNPEHPYIDTITVAYELHLNPANGYGDHSCDPTCRRAHERLRHLHRNRSLPHGLPHLI